MTRQSHPDGGALARFLDNALDQGERARLAAHLADCAECRADLYKIRRVLQTQPSPRRWTRLVPLAAAAAVLLIVWSGVGHRTPTDTTTRDPALTTALAPRPISPVGTVSQIDSLQWSAVPGARRYRLSVFSADGRIIWQASPTDTAIALPDSLQLTARTLYYWQIKAETSFGRWVESDLVTFTLTTEPAPR